MKDYELIKNEERGCYEFHIDGDVAEADYREMDGVVVLPHVGVPPHLEGQGVASQLVKKVLEDIKQQGLKVKPVCPFVVAYVKRHPEWQEMVV